MKNIDNELQLTITNLNDTDMIKGAIIGLGKMGLSHAAIVGAHSAVDMVGVCNTSSLVLNAFNKFSKVKTYIDHQKMINNELNLL